MDRQEDDATRIVNELEETIRDLKQQLELCNNELQLSMKNEFMLWRMVGPSLIQQTLNQGD